MKFYRLAISVLWATVLLAAETPRTWTSKQGMTLQGTMIGVEAGMVLIKKSNGELFKANLEALCPADVDYVKSVSFGSVPEPKEPKADTAEATLSERVTPAAADTIHKVVTPSSAAGDDLFGDATSTGRLVKVSLILDPHPPAPSIKELGVSIRPKLNDKVELNVNVTSLQNKGTAPDSAWTIESIDSISGTLKPQTDTCQPLRTDGMFYFLTYTVENNMLGPALVPIPIIKDSKNRKFYPLSALDKHAEAYIPEGMLSAEKDMLQPGLKKRFCSIYELPKGCIANSIDIFPIHLTKNPFYSTLIRSGQIQGKSIDICSSTASSEALKDNASKTDDSSEKASVFMACRQKALKGSSTTHIKTRVLSYSVDLRLTKPQQKEMTIKAYFLAADSEGDAIVDIVDQPIALQHGKLFSTTVESKPVAEASYYNNTYGAKLKGAIIQLWSDGEIVGSWASMSQWDKYAKMPDLQLKMRHIADKSPEAINELIDRRLERKDNRPLDRRFRN